MIMAKKQSSHYVCTNCGAISSSWAGKCSQCGEWNTLQEETTSQVVVGGKSSSGRKLKGQTIDTMAARDQQRLASGMSDVDTVLGGGLVAGSVILIAGQPGIGKSTLLMQLADAIAR